eukprot:9243938-Pyramimonas_sp.AAC.1
MLSYVRRAALAGSRSIPNCEALLSTKERSFLNSARMLSLCTTGTREEQVVTPRVVGYSGSSLIGNPSHVRQFDTVSPRRVFSGYQQLRMNSSATVPAMPSSVPSSMPTPPDQTRMNRDR